MNKSKLWIVNFQHTSHEVIKTMLTEVIGTDISEALENAKERIADYMLGEDEKERCVITEIYLAFWQDESLLDKIWTDLDNDPDPDLFD